MRWNLTPLQRFNDKWIPEPNSGCWLWSGAVNEIDREVRGYMWYKGGHRRASRISWDLRHGIIPEGLNVLHKCDTPLCVNPDHLFLGTTRENVHDSIKKGRRRYSRGHAPVNRKLTESQVLSIREDPRKSTQIYKEYPVSARTIRSIKNRKRWRNLA